jgi:hypothetical protein
MTSNKGASNGSSGSADVANVQCQVSDSEVFFYEGRNDGVGDIGVEYCKLRELEMLKHVQCGLKGELESQNSDVRHIVLEEAFDDLESGRFAPLSNHFNCVDRRCGIGFTLC